MSEPAEPDLSGLLGNLKHVPQSELKMVILQAIHCFGGAKEFGNFVAQTAKETKAGSPMRVKAVEFLLDGLRAIQPKELTEDDVGQLTNEDVKRELMGLVKKEQRKNRGKKEPTSEGHSGRSAGSGPGAGEGTDPSPTQGTE